MTINLTMTGTIVGFYNDGTHSFARIKPDDKTLDELNLPIQPEQLYSTPMGINVTVTVAQISKTT